jgi:hypothetical protein
MRWRVKRWRLPPELQESQSDRSASQLQVQSLIVQVLNLNVWGLGAIVLALNINCGNLGAIVSLRKVKYQAQSAIVRVLNCKCWGLGSICGVAEVLQPPKSPILGDFEVILVDMWGCGGFAAP